MSRSSIRGLRLALLVLPLSSRLAAQEEDYGPRASDWLVGLSATYRYSHSDSASGSTNEVETLTARLSAGWYLDRVHEFGLELQPNYTRLEDSPDTSDTYLGGFYNFNHWSSPRTTLYAGPQLGLQYTDASSSDTAFAWGLHCGVRYWLSTNVSVQVEPRLTIAYQEDALGGRTSNVDVFLGLSFKL